MIHQLPADRLEHQHRDFPVLYVDDEEENLLVFKATFGNEFEILEARSATEALSLLASEPVAVLLTDQRMPGMTGIELCERVRELYPKTRRMLITAYSDHQTAIEAINRGGVHAYLSKPWAPDEVRHTIRENLERISLERSVEQLRRGVDEKDRLLALAKVRDRILHDVAGVTTRLNLSARSLRRLISKHRSQLPEEFLKQEAHHLALLDRAIEHLVQLCEQRKATIGEELKIEPTSIKDILTTLEALVGPQHEGIRTNIEDSEDAVVSCDRLSVVRILLNLVKNAREAMAEANARGSVTVTARRVDEEVFFEVTDEGPGVAPSLREKVFEEHFSTRKERGGSGVGLASSRMLAEANHGALELPEVQPGRGALFRLSLHVAESAAPKWPLPAHQQREPGTEDHQGGGAEQGR